MYSLKKLFSYHSLPVVITLERDPQLTGLFWKTLMPSLGTEFYFRMAFYP